MISKNEIEIHFFGEKKGFFEDLFQSKSDIIKKDYGNIEKRRNKIDIFDKILSLKKSIYPYFVGYKYPELIDNNYKTIIFQFFKDIQNSVNKKIIIMKFGVSYTKEFKLLINKIETDIPCVLFIFPEEDKEEEPNFFESFKKPQYISYIKVQKDPNLPNKNYNKIISYIYEKYCYYNEMGNLSYQLLPDISKSFILCNILLVGESRAGKSSIINRIFNKFVSYESSKLESETKQLIYYDLYPYKYLENINEENGVGGIRIIDTPGLVKINKLNSFKIIKSKLDDDYRHINIIYFFLKSQSNIEQCIDLLKYIKNRNIERIKMKKNTIPIIFIKNGEDLIKGGNGNEFFQQLKNELKKNNLIDLYECPKKENDHKEEINEDNIFNEENDDLNDYEKYLDGNIIQIHLPTGKNMDKLFLKTKETILKNNELIMSDKYQNNFKQIRDDVKMLIQYFLKEKKKKIPLSTEEKEKYKSVYKNFNEFIKTIKANCKIVYNIDIFNSKANNKISTEIKYGFGKQDINNYELENYIYGKEKTEKKVKELLQDLTDYMGPIQCIIKARETLSQINNLFEYFYQKKEEDWNNYSIEKI